MERLNLSAQISRRNLIKVAGVAALASPAMVLAGCGGEKGSSHDQVTAGGKADKKIETPAALPVIEQVAFSEQEVFDGVSTAIDLTNAALGVGFNKEDYLARTHTVRDLATYQSVIANEEAGYQPSDELDRPAVTTERDPSETYYYLPSVNSAFTGLGIPGNDQETRKQVIEYLSTHELIHQSAVSYKTSQGLHDVIFGKMFANVPGLAGKKLPVGIVHGAEIKTNVDGIEKSAFQNLEEAEAIVIGGYSFDHNPNKKIVIDNPNYFGLQAKMLRDLLSKLPGGFDTSVKTLASLRMQPGGREKWMKEIANAFSIPDGDAYLFSGSVFYAIDSGDGASYLNYTTKK